MSVRLTASTGAEIRVWHEGDDVFHVERVDLGGEVQICLGVDLFEIVAELAELDLDDGTQAAEAVGLAEQQGASLLCRAPSRPRPTVKQPAAAAK